MQIKVSPQMYIVTIENIFQQSVFYVISWACNSGKPETLFRLIRPAFSLK